MDNINEITKVENEYGADEIQVLEGLEAVRKRPGMYIGSTGEQGLHHLVYEIVDNSIDEALAGYCTKIEVSILPGNIIRVKDNGRGIPVGINAKMGSSVVNALSEYLEVRVCDGKDIYFQRYEKGKIIKDLEIIGQGTEKGTEVVFKPDPDIFTDTTDYKYEIIEEHLREQAFFNVGFYIELKDERNPENVVVNEYRKGFERKTILKSKE